ncbi:glycosyltransferase family 2 protein [Bacillus mesophilum]|uniref:Glycosyltransferase family 2 protein n=1 Tax=Bacillus mesophilum TaxID=1071718 RepID=A0A7V7UV92_9BACI|nr:glycosyltransferase family A protein [Bacillus mesophilum]KAB2332601.1 glycosyltransferase family 2 protein [Bacillus mesophilum]
MNEQPLVSVVIPFYSGKKWLTEAIDSILEQTYQNIEMLVIDDGSKENIDDLTEKYKSINIIKKSNGGPASARNLGIEKSSGKYIAFLDSDDVWLPEKLLHQIAQMESKGYVWSQHSYEMFWENSHRTKIINTHIYSGNVYRDTFISFKVQTSCVVVLRSLLLENGIRFPVKKRFGQDLDFYRQIAKLYNLGYIDGTFTRFRIRGTNAGFRAIIQLNDKRTTWHEIKEDRNVVKLLPAPILFAYQIASISSNIVNFINKRFIKKESVIEFISKISYLFPYTLFKIFSKRAK